MQPLLQPFALPLCARQKATKKFVPSCFRHFQSTLCLLTVVLLTLSTTAQDRLVGLASKGGSLGGGTAFNLLSNGTGFAVSTNFVTGGKYPEGDLVKGVDGAYYGMTPLGGSAGVGTIFKVTTGGTLTILKNLDGTTGSSPFGSLTLASDGNFYGITRQGGVNGYGTIFKMTHSGVFTVLKPLLLGTTGSDPYSSLVQGTDGFLYGTARQGGTNNHGTIFKIDLAGTTFTVIKHLLAATTGNYPRGSLVQGTDGNFYGATTAGGTGNWGTIFKIDPTGSSFTVLKHLDNTTTGRNVFGRLIQGVDGAFYGMASHGGIGGSGLIFKITSAGIFTVVKNLVYATTGVNPQASLVKGSDGLFYGTMNLGGTGGYGTLFKMDAAGTTFTVLKHLDLTTGSYPKGSLVQGIAGTFYGMSNQGGTNGLGTIFKITSTGSFAVIAHFPSGGRGSFPQESLVQSSDGFFYGTAEQGGTNQYGLLFKLCTNGTYTILRNFDYSVNGATPKGSLVQGTDGYFYGMASLGGSAGYGTVFRMSSSGTMTVLRHLATLADGSQPHGRLVQGTDGFFYGMTFNGGTGNFGTIFKISSSGATFTVLKHLDNINGRNPYGSMIRGSDGNLYGMTTSGGTSNLGVVFKMTNTGTMTVLKHLTTATGTVPKGDLLQGSDGNLYGMTRQGGTAGYGTVFKINTTGTTFTVLKNLDFATTGGYPEGSLVQGADGSLYGMTTQGGTFSGGTIFKITTGGTLTVLRHLKTETDGGAPLGTLVIQKPYPVATPQSVTAIEDISKAITLAGTGGTPLTYAITTAPKNGTLTGSRSSRTYKGKPNFNGKDSFYFTVTWGCQTSAPAKVQITVTPVNDTPVLAPIGNKSIVKSNNLSFTAAATEVDAGQTKTFSLIGAPSGATINASSGVFSWTPGTAGNYSFTVRVTDNGAPVLFDEETIAVTVTSTIVSPQAKLSPLKEERLTPRTSIAPNPVRQQLTVTLSEPTTRATVRVLDLKGAVLQTRSHVPAGGKQLIVESGQLKPGHYLLHIQTERGTEVVKFSKQ